MLTALLNMSLSLSTLLNEPSLANQLDICIMLYRANPMLLGIINLHLDSIKSLASTTCKPTVGGCCDFNIQSQTLAIKKAMQIRAR